MNHCNKSGNVRNEEIFDLHPGSGAGPCVRILCPASCKTPVTLIDYI